MTSPGLQSRHSRNFAAALILACTAVGIDASGVIGSLELRVRDALLRVAVRHAPLGPAIGIPDAVVVALDARSLRARPDWPWPRSLHAAAIERLDAAGARVIAVDIDFSTPTNDADDARLVAATRESGRVIFASFRQTETIEGVGEIEITSVPFPGLVEASAGVGSVLVPVDPDGVVRRAPAVSSIAARDVSSLAIRALELAVGEHERAVEPATGSSGYFAIDYRRADPPIRRISIIDVIEDRFDPREIAGRVIFIGATSAEFQDLWTTPLGPAIPGVEIQAMAYRTAAAEFAGESPIAAPSVFAHGSFLFAISLFLSGFASAPQRRRMAVTCASVAVVIGSAVFASIWLSLLFSPLLSLVLVACHYVLGIESVQRSMVRTVRAQESSLQTLASVGEINTGRPGTGDALELTLGMLGDVVGATRVSLLRADESGSLDGTRIDWSPGKQASGSDSPLDEGEPWDLEIAQQALIDQRPSTQTLGRDGQKLPGIVSYTPLRSCNSDFGVLVVECRGCEELDLTQRRTVASVGAQLALSAQNLRLLEELRETFDSSMAAMASAVEARDGYTNLHCRRLAAFSAIMAQRLGLGAEEIRAITLGALLHDVGKIGICDAVLNKPGRFSPEERALMMEHPQIGVNIVGPVRGLSETTLHCVLHHHERWDGQGYPKGLAGNEIPLAARIVSVVDVWDALSSERPYKKAFPQEKVLALLQKGRGVEFDPEIVDLFLEVLDEQGEEMLDLIQRDQVELGE